MSHRMPPPPSLSLWATTRSTEPEETDENYSVNPTSPTTITATVAAAAAATTTTIEQRTPQKALDPSDASPPESTSLTSPLSFTRFITSAASPPPPPSSTLINSSPIAASSSLASPPSLNRSTSTPNPAAYGTTLYPFGLYGFGRPLSSYAYSPFAPISTPTNTSAPPPPPPPTATPALARATTLFSSSYTAVPTATALSTLSLGTSSPPSATRSPFSASRTSLTPLSSPFPATATPVFTTVNSAPPVFYSETEMPSSPSSSAISAFPPLPLNPPSSPSQQPQQPMPKTPKRCSIKEIATEISERCPVIQTSVVPFLKHMKQARDNFCENESNLASPSSDVYLALQQVFPSKAHRWGEWTRLLAGEGIEQMNDLMMLSEEELEETGKKWPVVLTSNLKKLRKGSVGVGGGGGDGSSRGSADSSVRGSGSDSSVRGVMSESRRGSAGGGGVEMLELYDAAEVSRMSLIQHVTPPPPPLLPLHPSLSSVSSISSVSSVSSSPSSPASSFLRSPCAQQAPFVLPSSFKNGAYIMERPLGKGQFGSAHLVRTIGGGSGLNGGGSSLVVLKLIRTTTREERNKAWKEARAMACIPKSEHLVHVLDFFEEDFGICIVMSYCAGGTVQDLVDQRLELAEVARIVLEIASGLKVLHENSMVHRDVKPDNVFLTDTRKVCIGDFGLARTSDDSGYIYSYGCRPYMAPELRMTQMSPASDMWALGCVAIGLLTGRTMEARHQIGAWMLGALPPQDIFDFVDSVTESLESHPLRGVVKGLLHPDHHLRISSAATVAALSDIPSSSQVGTLVF